MKKLFLIVAALFVAVYFSACSDDDDNKINPHHIVGTWIVTRATGYDIGGYGPGKRTDFDNTYPVSMGGDILFHYIYTFNADGTGRYKGYENDKLFQNWPLTYSIKNNQLLLHKDPDGDNLSTVYDIKELTKNQLVLFWSDEDEDSYCEETVYYKKL